MIREPISLSHIDYLVDAKYPAFRALKRDAYYIGPSDELADLEWRVASYREKLKEMPPDKLRLLYERFTRWYSRHRELNKARAAELRQQLEDGFTRRLKLGTDYGYWAKMPYWTSGEAAALMLEFSPEAGAGLASSTVNYAIVQDYRKLYELIRRAELAGQIEGERNKITPPAYMKWIKHQDFAFPADLENYITCISDGLNVRRYKSANLKPLSTRERETLLKMLFGVAQGGYGYDPRASKSSTVKEIYDDLALRGIALDQDTIRNKLKEAAQLVTMDASAA